MTHSITKLIFSHLFKTNIRDSYQNISIDIFSFIPITLIVNECLVYLRSPWWRSNIGDWKHFSLITIRLKILIGFLIFSFLFRHLKKRKGVLLDSLTWFITQMNTFHFVEWILSGIFVRLYRYLIFFSLGLFAYYYNHYGELIIIVGIHLLDTPQNYWFKCTLDFCVCLSSDRKCRLSSSHVFA